MSCTSCARMSKRWSNTSLTAGVDCSPVEEQGWGRLTAVTLPGGGKLGIYQPLHEVIADT